MPRNPTPIRTSDLRAAVAALRPVLGEKDPTLRAVRMEPGRLRAFDLETTVDVASPLLAGLPRATVDGASLRTAVAAARGRTVTITARRGAPVELTAGATVAAIDQVDAARVPAWPVWPRRMPMHALDPDEIAHVAAVAVTADTKTPDLHPALACVHLADTDGHLVAEACNRVQAATATIAADVVPGWSLLLPARVINAWHLGTSTRGVELWGPATTTGEASPRDRASVRVPNVLGPESYAELSWILTDRDFPNLANLFPTRATFTATLNRAALLDALSTLAAARSSDRVSVRVTPGGDGVALDLVDSLTGAVPGVRLTIPVKGTWPDCAFNPDLMLDVVRQCTGARVTIRGTRPNRPLVVTGSDRAIRYLVMPIHLRAAVRAA